MPCDIQLSQLEAVLCPGVVELGSIFDGWEGVLRFILKSRHGPKRSWQKNIRSASWLAACPVRQLLAEIIRSCRKLSCQRLLSSRPFSGADGSPYDPALSSLETSYTDFLTYLVFQKCSIPDMGHLWGKDYKNVIKFPDMSQNSSFLTPHLWGKKITSKNFMKNFQNPPHLFSLEIHLSSRNPTVSDGFDSLHREGPPMVVPRWHNLSPAPRPETKQTQRAIFTTPQKWPGKLNKILSNRWF